MGMDVEFRTARLQNIPDPLGKGSGKTYDFDRALTDFGFPSATGYTFGSEFGIEAMILGPAGPMAAYEWAVLLSVNANLGQIVWCESFADLQGFLISISSLITADALSGIREVMMGNALSATYAPPPETRPARALPRRARGDSDT